MDSTVNSDSSTEQFSPVLVPMSTNGHLSSFASQVEMSSVNVPVHHSTRTNRPLENGFWRSIEYCVCYIVIFVFSTKDGEVWYFI